MALRPVPNICERTGHFDKDGLEIFRHIKSHIFVYANGRTQVPESAWKSPSPKGDSGEESHENVIGNDEYGDDNENQEEGNEDEQDEGQIRADFVKAGNTTSAIASTPAADPASFTPSLFSLSRIVDLIEDCLEQLMILRMEEGDTIAIAHLSEVTVETLIKDNALFPDGSNRQINHDHSQCTMVPKWPFAASGQETMIPDEARPVAGPGLTLWDFHYQVLFDLIHWLRALASELTASGSYRDADLEIETARSKTPGAMEWDQKTLDDLGRVVCDNVSFRKMFLKIESVEYGPPALRDTASDRQTGHDGSNEDTGDEDSDSDDDHAPRPARQKPFTNAKPMAGENLPKKKSPKKTASRTPDVSVALPATGPAGENGDGRPQTSGTGAEDPKSSSAGTAKPLKAEDKWSAVEMKAEFKKHDWKVTYWNNNKETMWWELHRKHCKDAGLKDPGALDYSLDTITPKRMKGWTTPQFELACSTNGLSTKKELETEAKDSKKNRAKLAQEKLEAALKKAGHTFNADGERSDPSQKNKKKKRRREEDVVEQEENDGDGNQDQIETIAQPSKKKKKNLDA